MDKENEVVNKKEDKVTNVAIITRAKVKTYSYEHSVEVSLLGVYTDPEEALRNYSRFVEQYGSNNVRIIHAEANKEINKVIESTSWKKTYF